MAAPYVDYLIADSVVTADEERATYSEKIVTLPGSYLPVDDNRVVGPALSRSAAGLPDGAFVFACFNNSYKFSPEIFEVWMRLLQRTEHSVLWLSRVNAAAARNLKREASDRGIEPSRLVFAPFVANPADHLARLAAADLFLDTLPYNAHATAVDALLAGLPVLTCKGQTFAGRVGASLLHAAGLPELVTNSLAAYEDLALEIAGDPAKLAALKSKLATARRSQPLFDTSRHTRSLEQAYLEMQQRARGVSTS
jgi:predicted O-linked N-acetylglucosamine transferase (SPINDLY family)